MGKAWTSNVWWDRLERRRLLAADFAVGSAPEFLASADFNGDGRSDVVASSHALGRLTLLMGSSGGFAPATPIGLPRAPDFVAAADLDADGNADVVAVSFDAGSIYVLRGNGNGTFQPAAAFSAGAGPRAVVIGDFSGDGKLDLVVAKSFRKELSMLRGNGDGTFAAAAHLPLARAPADLAAGDFDGDGDLDLVAANYFNDSITFLRNGGGTFSQASNYATAQGPTSIATGDFNRDGKLDVAVAHFLAGNAGVMPGDGAGGFSPAGNVTAGGGATFVAAVDLNLDAKPDLVTINANENTVRVRRGNGNSTLDPVAAYTVGASPRSAAVGDFDGDGSLDLAIANQGGSSVTVVFAPLDTALASPSVPAMTAATDTGASNSDDITADNTPTFTGTAPTGTRVDLFADGVLVGSAVTGGGAYSIISARLADGVHQMTARASSGLATSATTAALAITIDTTAPRVASSQFSFETSPNAVSIVLSEDVSGSIALADFKAGNVDSGAPVQPTFTYTAGTRTAWLAFSPDVLVDGNYRVTLVAGSVQDIAGNAPAADTPVDFWLLRGDANRDRRVDAADVQILRARLNQSGTFSQGDFNYNGRIEIRDFVLLARRFNATVAAASPAARTAPALPQSIRAWSAPHSRRLTEHVDPAEID